MYAFAMLAGESTANEKEEDDICVTWHEHFDGQGENYVNSNCPLAPLPFPLHVQNDNDVLLWPFWHFM